MSSITTQERDEYGARLRMKWRNFWDQQEKPLRNVGYVLESRQGGVVVRRESGSTYEESIILHDDITYRRGTVIRSNDGSSIITFTDQSSNTGKAIGDADAMLRDAIKELEFIAHLK